MARRALTIVLDSVACGNTPDASAYGDEGADTLGHLFEGVPGLNLPNLFSLGLGGLLGISPDIRCPGAYRLTETSAGKDTTTGHWELMGCTIKNAFFTCASFPDDLVREMEMAGGTQFIGNKVASGTEILTALGEEHVRTGFPILYTSADSVLQIAAHEETFGLERLLDLCAKTRVILDHRGLRIGRVIARPFLGKDSSDFKRTGNRHDYSLFPEETALNRLTHKGVRVVGVGKISDIFAGSGISESHPTKDNAQGMAAIHSLWDRPLAGDEFVFANLVDFDSLFGHRRDPVGYANCLMDFDKWLGGFLPKVGVEDLVIITADHGNDPYFHGTDHTREQVPCLVFSRGVFDPGKMEFFSDVGACVERWFT